MSDVSLQRVLAFNEELSALAVAGVPVAVGVSGPSTAVGDKLERISWALSKRVQSGQGVEQAIEEETELPARYRAALRTWLRCDDPTVALAGVTLPAEARRQVGYGIGRALIYPLIILVFSYFGLLYLCSITVPRLEAIYGQLWRQPSPSLSALILIRDWMPVWGPMVPLLIVLGIFCWRSLFSSIAWRWVPGSAHFFRASRHAECAGQMAMLMEHGHSFDQALELLSPMFPQRPKKSQGAVADELPPLLRWASRDDVSREQVPDLLRLVARTYRHKADRAQAFWRFVVPTVCGVVLGSVLVLLYGLSLFLPIVQLLHDLALPVGA